MVVPSMAEIQALAASCVDAADPLLCENFERSFGASPARFAAMTQEQQQVCVQAAVGSIEAHPGAGLSDFRTWFGGSYVVDASGNPLVVYHGTNAHVYSSGEQIQKFHTRPASGRGGAFFSDQFSLAQQYGERVYAVCLSIKQPLIVHADEQVWAALSAQTRIGGVVTDAIRLAAAQHASEMTQMFAEMAELFDDEGDVIVKPKFSDADVSLESRTLEDLPHFSDGMSETDLLVKLARRLGFDGVIFKSVLDSPTCDAGYQRVASDVFVAFEPDQIRFEAECELAVAVAVAVASEPRSNSVQLSEAPSP